MVILLGLAAAVLYGSGDFLGGMATRRAHVLTVLALVETAGVIVALAAAAMWPGQASLAGLAWGTSAGMVGGLGLIVFYTGLAAGPMSVVAPVSGLVSTVLPVAVALAEGERPGAGVYAGALLCLVAIVLASSARRHRGGPARRSGLAGPGDRLRHGVGRLVRPVLSAHPQRRAVRRGVAGGGRADRRAGGRPGRGGRAVLRPGLLRGVGGGVPLAAVAAGAIDVVANICYVAATRTGAFGLAVVLASLYPGVTVLLARVVLGERLRWVQRAGLGLAAIGILLVAA